MKEQEKQEQRLREELNSRGEVFTEDEYVNETFPRYYERDAEEYKKRTGKELAMYVSCEIPEINLTLHTRCFACRIDESGELQSLENGDGEKFIEYFTP